MRLQLLQAYYSTRVIQQTMAAAPTDKNVVRVILWCIPRTTSTSFLKCMTYVPNSQVWYEPFVFWDMYSKYGEKRESMVSLLREIWGVDEGELTASIEGKAICRPYSKFAALLNIINRAIQF